MLICNILYMHYICIYVCIYKYVYMSICIYVGVILIYTYILHENTRQLTLLLLLRAKNKMPRCFTWIAAG